MVLRLGFRVSRLYRVACAAAAVTTQLTLVSASAALPKDELHDVYVGVVAFVGVALVLCLCQAARTCQRQRFAQDEVVVNYWLGCSVFGA